MNDRLVRLAENFGHKIHERQKRWGGEPYITHPERIANRCIDPVSKCIAWMHDTIEDGEIAEVNDKWIEDSFTECGAIYSGVKDLTRKSEESYSHYIIRLTPCSIVTLCVKLADLEDNMADLKPGPRLDKYKLSHYIIYNCFPKKEWNLMLKPMEKIDGKDVR
jgi:(p)ppGpp synthase/HD superfamily hydrolase